MSMTQKEIDILAQYGMKQSDFEKPSAEVVELKKFLADTDYIVTKLAERIALGLPTGDLLNQYQGVLQKRAEARARINVLEG